MEQHKPVILFDFETNCLVKCNITFDHTSLVQLEFALMTGKESAYTEDLPAASYTICRAVELERGREQKKLPAGDPSFNEVVEPCLFQHTHLVEIIQQLLQENLGYYLALENLSYYQKEENQERVLPYEEKTTSSLQPFVSQIVDTVHLEKKDVLAMEDATFENEDTLKEKKDFFKGTLYSEHGITPLAMNKIVHTTSVMDALGVSIENQKQMLKTK